MKTWTDIERANNAQILEWTETQSWARDMAACQQDGQWHAEGDVWTHTKNGLHGIGMASRMAGVESRHAASVTAHGAVPRFR